LKRTGFSVKLEAVPELWYARGAFPTSGRAYPAHNKGLVRTADSALGLDEALGSGRTGLAFAREKQEIVCCCISALQADKANKKQVV